MKIYLVRHGKAEAMSNEYPEDDLRPLTDEGKKELYELAQVWKKLGIGFDKLVTSPILRAKQTAEIIATAYSWNNEITERESLGHMFSVEGIIAMLDTFPGKRSIALIGHNPDLSVLASTLLGCRMSSHHVDFKKSAIMGIDFIGVPAVGTGQLLFYFPPKYLKSLME